MNSQASIPWNPEQSEKNSGQPLKISSYKCDKCDDTHWIHIENENSFQLDIRCECREMEILKMQ